MLFRSLANAWKAGDPENRFWNVTVHRLPVPLPVIARPATAGQQQSRAPTVGGGLERHGEMRQLSLAPDEPLAAEPRGHERIVPHGAAARLLDMPLARVARSERRRSAARRCTGRLGRPVQSGG